MISTSAETATRASASGFKTLLLHGVRLVVAAAVLLALWSTLDNRDLFAAFHEVKWRWLLLAAGLLLPNLWLQAVRWHVVLKCENGRATRKDAWRSLLGALPLGLVTPGRVGELGRAFFLPGWSWQRVSLLAMIDRAAAVLANFGLGCLAVWYLPGASLPDSIRRVLAPHVPLVLGFALLLLVLCIAASRRVRQAGRTHFARIRAIGLGEAAPRLRARAAKIFGLASLFVATFCLQHALLVLAFAPADFVAALAAALATHAIKTLLPFAFGDLGIREGAAVYFFAQAGVAPEPAVAAALLLFTINVLAPALLGLFVLMAARRQRSKPPDSTVRELS